MKPKPTTTKQVDNKENKSMLAAMFPGLSIPNDMRRASTSPSKEDEHKDEEKPDDSVNDMMAVLESMAPSKEQYGTLKINY